METFYSRIKLKGYFKDLNGNSILTEEQMNKLLKRCTPNKNHQTLLTYIEATQEELECKMENQKPQPFSNHLATATKDERTALQ